MANWQLQQTGNDHHMEVTMGHIVNTEATDPDAMIDAIVEAYGANNLPDLQSAQLTFAGLLVRFGPSPDGPIAERAFSIPGGNAQPDAPPNVAILVKKSTAFGGRQNRGRFYWPCPNEQGISNTGLLTSDYWTNLQEGWESFRQDIADAGYPIVILHSKESITSTPRPVTRLSVDTKVATQRRRLR
jgi:hypothetical protein